MKIKGKLINHKSARSLNLKLDSIKYNYQNKIYEIYSKIGHPGISIIKISLIENKPPLEYNLTTTSNTFYNKNSGNYNPNFSNSPLKNSNDNTSFSVGKIINLKKSNNSFFNLFKPLSSESIKKNSLNQKLKFIKNRNNFFNKAFYKGEIQSLSNRLFGDTKKKKKTKETRIEVEEDPFFSPNNSNNIDNNLLKSKEKLLSIGNSDKKYKIENYNSFNNVFS
jgi:hypothetical protein